MFSRGSGILMHLTSLPGSHGIGDLGESAYAFADRLAETKQRFWQILPLNPGHPGDGESPYFSSSAFAGNPLLISLPMLVEDGLLDEEDIAAPPSFPETIVDFVAVREYKIPRLEKAFHRFQQSPPKDFDKFCTKQAWWIDDYALYSVLSKEYKETTWTTWPAALRDRTPEALESAREEHAQSIQRTKAFQYFFFKQWFALKNYCNRKDILIVGDIPIYVSFDSADVWEHPEVFKLDDEKRPIAVSGVPPDYFSETGQLWNNPVYDWNYLKQTGYDWWVRRMAATFDRYDIVRIDHFRGLVQYWEVPAGEETAMNGTWQDVPTHDFFDTLIKRIRRFPVIAEDLGLITPDVHAAMNHYGFPGMKVLLFAFGEDNPQNPYLPHNYDRNAVVYTGTHDNNTFCGWLRDEAGSDEKRRFSEYVGREAPPEEAVWDAIRLGMRSVADLCIIPLQDYLGLGSSARMNQPAKKHGNWQWRATPDQLNSIDWETIGAITKTYGRDFENQNQRLTDQGSTK